jgi:AcrR family transcriptional regulator
MDGPGSQPAPEETGHGGPAARTPIGRGGHARARVLRAALEILAEEGLPALTMDAIARRAGASKATLYRRWSSRAALLVDAMAQAFEPPLVPLTGHLRVDLLAMVREGEALIESQPFARLMAAVIDAGERDASLATMHEALTGRRREPFLRILEEARRRGEIAAEVDLELATDLLVGPLFYRRFVSHRPPAGGFGEALVDRVLRAVGPDR